MSVYSNQEVDDSSPSPAEHVIDPFAQQLPAIRAAQLSAAFASISEQLAHASDIFAGFQAATASSSAQHLVRATNGVQEEARLTPELESLHARLDAIEHAQSMLANDVERIKAQVVESEHARVSTPVPVHGVINEKSSSTTLTGAAPNEKIEELEKKIKELTDTIKLE